MNVLVTGAAGFVGINLVESLLKHRHLVTGVGRSDMPPQAKRCLESLGGFVYYTGDILDTSFLIEIMREHNIDAVIHGAVVTASEQMERMESRQIFEINCGGTISVLDAASQAKTRRFIYVSSISAYGRQATRRAVLSEEMEVLVPESLYEISKYASERLVLRRRFLTGLNAVCCRLGGVFGPWERPTDSRSIMSAPFQTLQCAIEGREAVLSRPNRTNWVYVKDVAEGLSALLADTPRIIYNLGSFHTWSISQWCSALERRFPAFHHRISKEEESNIQYSSSKDSGILFSDRLHEDTGWVARFGLEEALEDYLGWISDTDEGSLVPS